MRLSDYNLRQIDDAYLQSLDLEGLRYLSSQLLADLHEARERLDQGPTNSSRPPSSQAPWERGDRGGPAHDDGAPVTETEDVASSTDAAIPTAASDEKLARKPGKQPGAPGFGRTRILPAHHTQAHYPATCAGCGQSLIDGGNAVAYTGFQALDLREGEPGALGLQVEVIDHRYYEVTCACGHHTRATPGQGTVDPALTGVNLNEWRLIGPALGALIVVLSLRFRMSRPRIQEFLQDWLGIDLSIGTIHQAIHEAGAAVLPAEAELIAAVQASGQLHVDETLWIEGRHTAWLWVFTAATVTLYAIASRGRAILDTVLAGFNGWLMSDGWCAYRHFEQRLRCWAHLLRKAQGLIDSYGRETRAFGHQVLDVLKALMAAVYAAREGPPTDLPTRYAEDLARLRATCAGLQEHTHAKTRALAVELLNDWDAIFQVLHHPALPLTNNEAERALRHWVILRKISHGTRTPTGSRTFTVLASVITTCRQRGQSPWPYLRATIADRRAGRPLAPLPAPVMQGV